MKKFEELKTIMTDLVPMEQAFDECDLFFTEYAFDILKEFDSNDWDILKSYILDWTNGELRMLGYTLIGYDNPTECIEHNFIFYLTFQINGFDSLLVLEIEDTFYEDDFLDSEILNAMESKITFYRSYKHISQLTLDFWTDKIEEKRMDLNFE